MRFLGRLLRNVMGRSQKNTKAARVELLVMDAFEGPFYAVGDVHGCLALYKEIETKIVQDALSFGGPPTIILLGDIVDRGPQSAALVDHLLAPPPGATRRLCLMGNHEEMMLNYWADPAGNAMWLHKGGHETLASYGMSLDVATLEQMSERKLRQTLAAHIPERHIRFLRDNLCGVQVGPYLLAHAGADADAPLTAQPRQALIWGDAGLTAPGNLTLVHGHYVVDRPAVRNNSIGIDTGAYATGRLTALRLQHGQAPAVLTLKDGSSFRNLGK